MCAYSLRANKNEPICFVCAAFIVHKSCLNSDTPSVRPAHCSPCSCVGVMMVPFEIQAFAVIFRFTGVFGGYKSDCFIRGYVPGVPPTRPRDSGDRQWPTCMCRQDTDQMRMCVIQLTKRNGSWPCSRGTWRAATIASLKLDDGTHIMLRAKRTMTTA